MRSKISLTLATVLVSTSALGNQLLEEHARESYMRKLTPKTFYKTTPNNRILKLSDDSLYTLMLGTRGYCDPKARWDIKECMLKLDPYREGIYQGYPGITTQHFRDPSVWQRFWNYAYKVRTTDPEGFKTDNSNYQLK